MDKKWLALDGCTNELSHEEIGSSYAHLQSANGYLAAPKVYAPITPRSDQLTTNNVVSRCYVRAERQATTLGEDPK